MNRLPVEILSEIFKSDTESHLRCSHVCRRWRELIHRCSLFWSRIELCLLNPELDQHAAYWLKHAGSQPLSISIQCNLLLGQEDVPQDDDYLVPLALVLRGHMARCEELEIIALPPQIQCFMNVCAVETPLLRRLIIRLPHDCRNDDEGLLFGNIWHPPLVVSFALPRNPPLPPRTLVKMDNWYPRFLSFGEAITELEIEGRVTISKTDDLLRMFRSCPNLVKCFLSGDVMKQIGEATPLAEPVALPHLTYLRIHYISDVENLLDALDLPSLQHLDIWELEWHEVMLGTFWDLFRSCTSLSSISLTYDSYCSETDLPDFAGDTLHLPSVTRFTCHGNIIVNALLRQLVLPNVQELKLRNVPSDIVHQLVSSSTQLCTAAFGGTMGTVEDPPIITLPTLSSLEITGTIDYINRLHLPQLSSLMLGHNVMSDDTPQLGTLLSTFVERSAPPLVTLKLDHLDVPDQPLIWCLERLPLLEVLSLRTCTTTDAVIHALSSESTGDFIVPRLTYFTFQRTQITPAAFIAFLSSRLGRDWIPPESAAAAAGGAGARPRLEGKVSFQNGPISQEDRATIRSMGNFLSHF
ncbi:hypothetical protein BOTBODRAFT_25742 [Botryobasidium botryosum FD-172 SS1]|uniref:F-box domain-containing protein n=1 Tax=Botryobasidium botryosum (strain FD-172 SS1) TaxID=930990 RepID=A0A067NB55_BOTB1|nr:hypothetical protein BOTBODRAFT_25742 [Botryobasidium botryosum FD-172 SS1]